MTEERFPAASHAPFSIVAISALLLSQGGIWAALAVLSLYLSRWLPASALITAVLFGFAALSWALAALLPRRGGEKARIWVIADEVFIAFLGLTLFGIGVYLSAPIIALFIVAGIVAAVCAAASLHSGSARDYCRGI